MTPVEFEAKSGITSIALRPGVIVQIGPMPHDLKKAEAEKIANVIKAFAGEK